MSQDPRIEAAAKALNDLEYYQPWDTSTAIRRSQLMRDATAAVAAIDKAATAPVGFVVVDIKTRKMDWDGEMHPTREAAIESLTGAYQMWCRTPDEATDERTYYGEVYEILPVMKP